MVGGSKHSAYFIGQMLLSTGYKGRVLLVPLVHNILFSPLAFVIRNDELKNNEGAA